jgi:hypothetical protein
VREHGLGCSHVDIKAAAIDATWSALIDIWRRRDR